MCCYGFDTINVWECNDRMVKADYFVECYILCCIVFLLLHNDTGAQEKMSLLLILLNNKRITRVSVTVCI